jgi:hypothetical protein
MSSLSQRLIEKGIAKGEANVLSRLIELKFGPEAVAAHTDELAKADADTLMRWSERILTAESPDDVFTH